MHIWLSPQIALESAIAIHNVLVNLFPEKKNIIHNNLKIFKINLLQADKYIKHNIQTIKKQKYFIFHNAYKYFEKYYQLHSIGYLTKYPEIQIGARYLYEIKKRIIENKIICIFTEPQFHQNIINLIIRGTNIRKRILDPLGTTIPLSVDSYIKFILKFSHAYIDGLKT